MLRIISNVLWYVIVEVVSVKWASANRRLEDNINVLTEWTQHIVWAKGYTGKAINSLRWGYWAHFWPDAAAPTCRLLRYVSTAEKHLFFTADFIRSFLRKKNKTCATLLFFICVSRPKNLISRFPTVNGRRVAPILCESARQPFVQADYQ